MSQRKSTLKLPARFAAAAVGDLRPRIKRIVGGRSDVVIDAGQVETIDTAGFQMLMALQHTLETQHRAMFWSGISASVATAAKLGGFDRPLQMPESG